MRFLLAIGLLLTSNRILSFEVENLSFSRNINSILTVDNFFTELPFELNSKKYDHGIVYLTGRTRLDRYLTKQISHPSFILKSIDKIEVKGQKLKKIKLHPYSVNEEIAYLIYKFMTIPTNETAIIRVNKKTLYLGIWSDSNLKIKFKDTYPKPIFKSDTGLIAEFETAHLLLTDLLVGNVDGIITNQNIGIAAVKNKKGLIYKYYPEDFDETFKLSCMQLEEFNKKKDITIIDCNKRSCDFKPLQKSVYFNSYYKDLPKLVRNQLKMQLKNFKSKELVLFVRKLLKERETITTKAQQEKILRQLKCSIDLLAGIRDKLSK